MQISATQIEMFCRCPQQYYRRYICKEIIPPGIAMVQGSAVHKAASVNFQQKIGSKQDLPVDDLVDCAVTEFDDQVKKYDIKTSGEDKDVVVTWTRAHAHMQAPNYMPAAVETKLTMPVPEVDGCSLIAILDLISDDGAIIDFKNKTRRLDDDAAARSTQLAVYDYAFRKHFGRRPKKLALDVLAGHKNVTRQFLAVDSSDDRIERMFIRRAQALLRAIQTGTFPPCDPTSWMCNPKWCGYYDSCPYV